MLLLYRGEEFDPNFYYHSRVDIGHSFLLAAGGKKILFTSRMDESLARTEFKGRVVAYHDFIEALSPFIKRKSVLYDASSMSARMAERLGKICRLKDHSVELLALRGQKRPNEVSCIRKAARMTKEIFGSLDFNKAKTELDIKKQLLLATLELGLEPAFEPIVSTDENTSFPHFSAGNKRLGRLVLVDYGVKFNHYRSDLSRCFILDADRKKKAEYESLKNICHSIADALPDMEKGREVADFAEKEITGQKFPRMIHAIGHGVGLEIHEFPRLGMKSDDKIAKSVIAIEPAFYYPKKYGMRYEETIWFDGKKARIL
jgi:Xaa-Pro aminopeptidase